MKQIKVYYLRGVQQSFEVVSAPNHREARSIVEQKYDDVVVMHTEEKI